MRKSVLDVIQRLISKREWGLEFVKEFSGPGNWEQKEQGSLSYCRKTFDEIQK